MSCLILLPKLAPGIGRATGGEETETAIDGGLVGHSGKGWRRGLGNEIGGSERDDDEQHAHCCEGFDR